MGSNALDAYKDRNAQLRPFWESMNGKQTGDPQKLANVLVTIADEKEPPVRWFAGKDAVAVGDRKVTELQSQVDPYGVLSCSLAVEE